MKITAVYPGTFDPITNGHTDITLRAARLFDRVILAVAATGGHDKRPAFSLDERLMLARKALQDCDRVQVLPFDCLTAEFAREQNAQVLIRGLRAVSDFDYEFQMAGMNRRLFPEAETVFLTPAEPFTCISSSLVREVVRLGGDVREFVHPAVFEALAERLGRNNNNTRS